MNSTYRAREKYYVYLLSSIHLSICFSLFLYLYWSFYHVYTGVTPKEHKSEKMYINGHAIAVCAPNMVISVYSQNVATLFAHTQCVALLFVSIWKSKKLCNNSWTSGGISMKHTAAHEAMQQSCDFFRWEVTTQFLTEISYELQIYWNQCHGTRWISSMNQ